MVLPIVGSMTAKKDTPPQVAGWLFLAAILAFASSSLFDGQGLWRWNVVVLGFVFILVGCVRLGVEVGARRRRKPPEA
ncbi:hypothetical protein MMX123_01950 [Microbacterium sp. MM2322]